MKDRETVALDLITWYALYYNVDIEHSMCEICRLFDVIAAVEDRDVHSIKFEEVKAYIITNFPVQAS